MKNMKNNTKYKNKLHYLKLNYITQILNSCFIKYLYDNYKNNS